MSFKQIDPRIRVSRTAALTLSTTFQRIDFSAGSADTLNVNTFGVDPASQLNMVAWDSTNKIFKFGDLIDKNYIMTLFFQTTASILATRATLQYRCVIPNGISAGVDYYFPFTGKGEYVDADEVTILTTQNNREHVLPVYASQVIRTNGFGIDVKLSNLLALTGVATLSYAACLIQ